MSVEDRGSERRSVANKPRPASMEMRMAGVKRLKKWMMPKVLGRRRRRTLYGLHNVQWKQPLCSTSTATLDSTRFPLDDPLIKHHVWTLTVHTES
jgi:hypothetical protein